MEFLFSGYGLAKVGRGHAHNEPPARRKATFAPANVDAFARVNAIERKPHCEERTRE
jgi:hypothetical protein